MNTYACLSTRRQSRLWLAVPFLQQKIDADVFSCRIPLQMVSECSVLHDQAFSLGSSLPLELSAPDRLVLFPDAVADALMVS